MRTLKPRKTEDEWVPPSTALFTNLEATGKYWRLSEVAKILNCSEATLRRLLKNPDIKAPSHYIQRGKMMIYVYNEADLEELKRYFDSSTQPMTRKRQKDN